MSKKKLLGIATSAVALLLVAVLLFQDLHPLIRLAGSIFDNLHTWVDMSRPDGWDSLGDLGIDDEDGENTETVDDDWDNTYYAKEPEDYYSEDKELEELGVTKENLVHYDENSRTYVTGKNQYVTIFGGNTGTYVDENGEVHLVDNTLESTRFTMMSGKTIEGYTNKENSYKVVFPKAMTTEAGIAVTKGDYYVEVIPMGGDYSHSVVKENAIVYNNVYDNINVQYTAIANSIKEDIVLLKKSSQTTFRYVVNAPGMEAELVDNQLYLYPEGKTVEDVVYILEAPIMEDAAGEISMAIELELSEQDGKTILTVEPNQEWLNDEARQYPVRIDPTTVVVEKQFISFACVEENTPGTPIGDNAFPYVGFDDGGKSGIGDKWHGNCRTYVRIDSGSMMETIPADVRIISASFHVSQLSDYSQGKTNIGLFRVDESWEVDVTWDNQPKRHTFVDSEYAAVTEDTYIDFDITTLVNDWIKGTYPNYGFVLKATDEAGIEDATMQCEILNNKTKDYGPKIVIEWGSTVDPFLETLTLDDTVVKLRPMTEKSLDGMQKVDGVFADGHAQYDATVYYCVTAGSSQSVVFETQALAERAFPDSTEFNKIYPNATKYTLNESNWQSALFDSLQKDTIYQIRAVAAKEVNGQIEYGKEVVSDSFLIYEVKQFDTLPKIAKYYGVSLKDIMKDNQVQDTLVVAGNTLFIRNPKTTVPYNPPALTDLDKMKIDGALMGRGQHCQFGFEPVNLNTGNFYMDETDVSMNELGGAFEIGRGYNSLSAEMNSMFGRGWSFTYDQALYPAGNGELMYKRGDGSFLFFTPNGNGTYTAPDGYTYTLQEIIYQETAEDGSIVNVKGWQMTDAAQSRLFFDKYGVLKTITDVNGFVTTLSYDADYNLSGITTPSGKKFGIIQNSRGFIACITLPDGSNLTYDYDGNNNLIAATNANGDTCTYQYDASHRMTSWSDENGNLVIKNVYDEKGRVIKQTDANGSVATLIYGENTTTTIDNEGNKTVYKYDDNKRTIAITYPDGSWVKNVYNDNNQLASETTAKGTKKYTYDSFGNIATETREDGAVATYQYNAQNKLISATGYEGGTVTYTYDSAGNMVSYTQADGSKVSYTYDSLHRLISQTDGRGVTITYTYDGPNQTTYVDGNGKTWKFTYDVMNRMTSTTDPLGNTTSVTYDRNGNKTSEIAADGGRTTYKLDALGNILSSTDPRGKTTTYVYDKLYNVIQSTDANGNTVSFAYNKNNQEIKATDALGNTITYTRDSMGRVIKETNAAFGTKLYKYDLAGNLVQITDGEGHTTTSEFNSQGEVVKVTDALGNVTRYEYDFLGNVTKVIHADGSYETKEYDSTGRLSKEVNRLGEVLTYRYDANGNLLSITDDSGRSCTYVYDHTNKKVKETNPEGGISTYTYDAAGRQTSYTDPLGRTEYYTYDAVGRVTSVTDALGQVTKNTYDLAGNLTSSTDVKGHVTKYTYDALGNMTSITDPLGNITAMRYDANGQLVETLDALKGITTYEYDAAGNKVKMTDALGNVYTYTYDKNGNNTSLTAPDGSKATMRYNAIGQLISMTDAQGLTVTYQYDSVGRVAGQKDNAGNELRYTYDAAGNVTSETDQLGRTKTYTYDKYGRLLTTTAPNGGVTTYEYDIMDRVTAVTDAAGTRTAFTYDKAGNQLTMTEADGAQYSYVYDALNRVVSTTNPLGGTERYIYDAAGNVVAHTDANGTTIRYTYDANGNNTSITDGKGNQTTYVYDELGRLMKETAPEGETKEYRYDALGNLIKYQDAEGAVTQYKYDSLGNMVETISPKGKSTTYTYDKHGNVLSETDAKGNVTAYEMNLNDQVVTLTQANGGTYTYEYDEAGRIIKTTSPLGFVTEFTYDVMDNVVEESNSLGQTTTYTYDILGRMTGSVNAKGGSTLYDYDFRNNLISETNALGYTTSYTYDVLSRMVEEKNPLGHITAYTYDPVGNLASVLAPGGAKTTYSYDANYNVADMTDPLGNVTKYAYDKSNRIITETDALNQNVGYTYNANGQVITETDKAGNRTGYTYDIHGNVITVTDRAGYNTHYSYDELDLMTRVETAGGSSAAYTYDSMGSLITYTSALGKVTTYTYDLEGNQTSRTDGEERTETYVYDEAGRLTSLISAGGNVVTYDYDELNQLIEKAYSNANGETTDESVLYGYDALGNRLAMTDSIGSAEYLYDALGRVTSVKDSAGQTVTYTYDERGNVTAIGYPDGTAVTYEYDLNNNLTKVTDRNGESTTYEYDALNRMVATYRPNYLATYVTYDELDHITKLETIHMVTGRLAASYEYIYNEEGYITKEIVKETIVSQWFEEIYDLFLDTILKHIDIDKYDRIMEEWKKFYDAHHIFCDHNDADGGGQYDNCLWSYMTATSTYEYRYDENWQLTKCTEKLQNGIITEYDYQYDKDGNRSKYVKTVNGEWTECYTYEYNAANQLVSRKNERLWTDNVTTYTYDADGNLLSEKTGLFEKTYEYTAENRLAVVKAQGTVLMAALYDGDGNRLFTMDYTGENNDRWDIWIPECGGNADKVDDSAKDAMKELAGLVSWRDRKDYTITEYVNDVTRENEEVLAELNPRGKVTTAYTYGYNRESADVYGDTQYYLYDGKGNVDRISSEWGRVKETYNYDPYGNLTYGIPDTVNYYGYNGESSNLATGLQYLRARYYSPQTGNFITEDTYAGDTSNPLTLNRYTYTSNNPVNRIDPSGHSWLDDAAKAIGKGIKKAGSAIGTGIKKAASAVVETGKKVVEGVKKVASDAWNAITHPKETIQKAQQAITETAQKADNFVQEVKKDPAGTFNKIKTKATTKIEEIKSEVKRAACTSAEYIQEGLGKIDWATVGKAAVGGALVIGAGIATVATGGAALPVLLGVVGGGALGGGANALVAWANGESKEDIGKAFVDGFMWGSITGVATGGLGMAAKGIGTAAKVLKNPIVQNAAEGLIETGIETVQTLSTGEKVTMAGIATSLALNSLGLFGGNKADDALELAKKVDVEEIVGDTMDDLADAGKKKSPVLKMNLQFFAEKSGSPTEVIMPSKPHTNGTQGHWETILDEVDIMKNSGDYSKIYVNKGLSNEIPGAKPNRRPDIMGVRNNGLIDQVEVPSKTDIPDLLIDRMIDNQRIIGDRAGNIKIRNIGGN